MDALAIDPKAPQILYAGTEQGVFKSTDGGASWRRASKGLGRHGNVQELVIDPQRPETLYVVLFDRGVFTSTDGGRSWRAVNRGLTNRRVEALAIDLAGTTLYAGTLGSGAFALHAA